MSRFPWRWLPGLSALFVALCAAPAAAQAANDPHIGYVYPAGGPDGTVFEVTVGGQHLDGVKDVFVSGAGVRASVIGYEKPLNRKQMGELRDMLRELQRRRRSGGDAAAEMEPIEFQGKDLTAMSAEEITALRDKLFDPKKQPNSQIAETVTLHVAVAADVEPGVRELRLITAAGVTNPLRFHVGRLPEVREEEPNDRATDKQVPKTLPVVFNGQIMPGDVDRFRFAARGGERIVVTASARELVPYLADAVPGWFQATLALYDAKGNELAFADDYRFHPDPVMYFVIPAAGEYILEIRDSIYRGREDFVYRIAVGELPFVTSIFPLGGQVGEPTTVSVQGWNLTESELHLGGEDEAVGLHPVTAHGASAMSNAVPFERGTLPECLEVEPNDGIDTAQWLSLPKVVNGRIGAPGDRDVFLIVGRAGDEIVAEVQARRLHSPLDSVLWLTDAEGAELARNDDYADRGAGLTTHQADSRLTHTLEADGRYFLHLADAQHKGGEAYAYRLRVGPLQPDFALRVVPSSLNVAAGATIPLTVHALRRDGYAGPIRLKLRDAPQGFVLNGGWMPPDCDELVLTLTAPADVPAYPVRLSLEGRAEIEEREVRHLAVPAEDMMQAFLNRHLVPAHDLLVAITERRQGTPPLRLLDTETVRLPRGGTAEVKLRGPRKPPRGEIQLELRDAPAGISIQELRPLGPETGFVLHADAEQVPSGWKGNLLVEVFIERPVTGKDGAQTDKTRRASLGVLPAIRCAVVGK